MDQGQRRLYLIQYLLAGNEAYRGIGIPGDERGQKDLLRSLFNLRLPGPVSPEFEAVQDAYLQEEIESLGITDAKGLAQAEEGICLWRGDITRLRCGAIVNAANSGMTGCYQPLHACVDNLIHTYAGVQLRGACARLMEEQGHGEPAGRAKITPAYNLPCDYVLHTVGPIVSGPLRAEDERLLASCYAACLRLAEENHCRSVAFCCISTGVFGFPKQRAAEIAVETVRRHLRQTGSAIRVIFDVYGDEDEQIYQRLLGQHRKA